MTERPTESAELPAPLPTALATPHLASLAAAGGNASPAWTLAQLTAWLTGGLAVAALLSGVLLWQKLDRIQEELARRSLDAGAQSLEARGLARQAQDGTRELAARQTLLETRLSEVSLQRSQLEELMQTLSRSRDETLVVDVESALKLAQQQAQLAGTAEPLLAALQAADQRIARAAQPRLNSLQRAIVRDLNRIRSANLTDVPALLLKLDELSRLTDELPLVNGAVSKLSGAVSTPPAAGTTALHAPAPTKSSAFLPDWMGLAAVNAWGQRLLSTVWDEASKLLRVSRIEQPEAALMSPEQGFFVRENLKLRLLNARMGLLSRQTDTARADLVTANNWLGKYFDATSRKTQTAAQLLQQVQSQLKTSDLPRLDETMAALATAAAGR
ncbi:MAG: uroporphyrinogen-III C-methyltransferase [Polaromonas sp.]|nr:uroporphyrinogen-III C-methyltransferase [Polaromonas sp.]